MGHSQGSTHGSLMAAYEPDIIGVVLSGNGGHLTTSMLTKTKPVDIAKVVPFGLLDPDKKFNLAGRPVQSGAGDHPVGVRPRGPGQLRAPSVRRPDGRGAGRSSRVHDLRPRRLVRAGGNAGRVTRAAARLIAVMPTLTERLGLPPAPRRSAATSSVGSTTRTVGLRQYTARRGDSDGHFVGVSQGPARPRRRRALPRPMLDGQTPAIGQ